MTILEIWTITWIHAVNEEFHTPSPAYAKAVHRFLRMGLVRPSQKNATGYETTELGADYVERLKAVPPISEDLS